MLGRCWGERRREEGRAQTDPVPRRGTDEEGGGEEREREGRPPSANRPPGMQLLVMTWGCGAGRGGALEASAGAGCVRMPRQSCPGTCGLSMRPASLATSLSASLSRLAPCLLLVGTRPGAAQRWSHPSPCDCCAPGHQTFPLLCPASAPARRARTFFTLIFYVTPAALSASPHPAAHEHADGRASGHTLTTLPYLYAHDCGTSTAQWPHHRQAGQGEPTRPRLPGRSRSDSCPVLSCPVP